MRYSSMITVGLGLVIVLPAVSAPQTTDELRHALSETVRALSVLTGLEKDLRDRPAEQAVELARSASEPAISDERERDERMQQLRKDVGRLQMVHDELAAQTGAVAVPTPITSDEGTATIPSVTITTGLDDRMRSQLSGGGEFYRSRPATSVRIAGADPTLVTRDSNGDALRQGQALLRAGKAKEALLALSSIEADVRAKYWMARSLERLGRVEEALDLYQTVAKDPSAGYLAGRARNDGEFLDWKRSFTKKLDGEPATSTPTKRDAAAKEDA